MQNEKESIANKIESIFGDFGAKTTNNSNDKEITPFSAIVSGFENATSKLVNVDQSEVKTIDDKDYLGFVFKHMIMVGMRAVEKLESNIKVGGKVGDGEDFASAFKSLTECVSKLVELRFKLFDVDNMMNPVAPAQINSPNLVMSGKEVLNMIKEAEKSSQLNSIVAKFEVEDGSFKESKKPEN